MAPKPFPILAPLLGLYAVISSAQVLTKCPSAETTYTSPDGLVYKTCTGTDYQGTDAQLVPDIADAAACVALCAKTIPCDKSVYNNDNKDCHLKGSDTYGLKWTTDARFTASRRVDVGNVGRWGPLVNLPVIPVAGYVDPTDTNRVMVWSSWGTDDFGGAGGKTQFADYNWKTGAVSERQVANTKHDMFCPGISALQDGRIVISGGGDAEATSIYDPVTNAFTRGPDMNIARGYQASATLSNGKIFTIGGSYSGGIANKPGEVYDPAANTWTLLPGADPSQGMLTTDHEGQWRTDNHAWLFAWRDGSVFQAGPSKNMHWFTTTGNGSIQDAGTRDAANDAMCGVNVMYDAGKIFTAGGSQDYTDSPAFNRAHLISISAPYQPAAVERVSDMRYPRGFANAVALPDGTILVTGGQKRSVVFTDTDSALAAELFDPATNTFRTLAEELIPRNYHSISLLLADGTVLSGGGGLCYVGGGVKGDDGKCNRAVDHLNAQIFSPPYLFNSDGSSATRPVISSVSATNARAGDSLTVQMGDDAAGTTFSLIRMGSSTHSINTDQRRISLTQATQSGSSWKLELPSDGGVLIPGYYYLFAVNKAGVPAVARTLQIRL
ncbi:galactose oxidase precursor [Lecanosticta acicola]|uniref:Galactose oxidase n=1 Tax=Lecanosticta acicola TaxID=111012 RepID=A0AAI9EEH3_9PEZI|nr:galactose oxidase precursor [Lecanosticta acicola]